MAAWTLFFIRNYLGDRCLIRFSNVRRTNVIKHIIRNSIQRIRHKIHTPELNSSFSYIEKTIFSVIKSLTISATISFIQFIKTCSIFLYIPIFVGQNHVAVFDQKYGRQSTGLSFCAMTVPIGIYNDCCEEVSLQLEQMSHRSFSFQ